MSIEKRQTQAGISYYARVRYQDYFNASKTFKKLSEAKNWQAKTLFTAATGGSSGGAGKERDITLTQAITRYTNERHHDALKGTSNKKSRIYYLNYFNQKIGSKKLKKIKSSTINKIVDELKKEKTSSTINAYLFALSALFVVAVNSWEILDSNPVAKVKKQATNNERVRYLSDSERDSLLEACKASRNSELYLFTLMLLTTGARKSEILNLTWQDINIKQSTALLATTKNKSKRCLPLVAQVKDLLIAKKDTSRTNKVFATKYFNVCFKTALKTAKVIDFTFHDLRHTTASYLAMQGVDMLTIATLLGHKNISMTQRYAHLSNDHTLAVASSLADKMLASD